jgi:hypothetical protein
MQTYTHAHIQHIHNYTEQFSHFLSVAAYKMRKRMKIEKEYVVTHEEGIQTIGGYQVIPDITESDELQRQGYMTFLRQLMSPLIEQNRLFIVDIANDNDALTVVDDRMGCRLNGTADVLLTTIEGGTFPDPLAGIVAVVEIKKKI